MPGHRSTDTWSRGYHSGPWPRLVAPRAGNEGRHIQTVVSKTWLLAVTRPTSPGGRGVVPGPRELAKLPPQTLRRGVQARSPSLKKGAAPPPTFSWRTAQPRVPRTSRRHRPERESGTAPPRLSPAPGLDLQLGDGRRRPLSCTPTRSSCGTSADPTLCRPAEGRAAGDSAPPPDVCSAED